MSNVSTFGAFSTARLGMYASQRALEIVGNNIANINTEGYTRQALEQRSMYIGGADRYTSISNLRIGGGVRCIGVSQIRDPYLDIRYRNASADVGSLDAKLSGLEQIAGILDEVGKGLDGEGILEAQFNDLITQIENLVTQGAGTDQYDTLVKGSAKSLVTLLNTYADNLTTLYNNQEKGLQKDVNEVNSILTNIRELNETIRKNQIHGKDPLELLDERNVLIDKLSNYMRIDVTYTQENVGAGTMVEKLVIKLAGNDPNSDSKDATLVDGNYVTQLQLGDKDNNYDITLDALKDDDGVVMDIKEQAKDKDGKLLFDKYGYPVMVATGKKSTEIELTDNDLYGSLQSMRELLTEQGEYATTDDINGDPNATTKRGIPYYQKTLDALANKLATILNEANQIKPGDKDANGNPIDIYDANGDLKPEYAYYNGGALFSNSGDGNDTTNITAANISISKAWADGEVHILQSKKPHDTTQSTDNSNLTHILYLMKEKHPYAPGDTEGGKDAAGKDTVYFTGSFQEMFGHITDTLAGDTQTTVAKLQNYSTAANQLYVDRDSVSGVDLNDEALGMIQYQKSYSAACRLMTTIDECLDKLINGTGRAGL